MKRLSILTLLLPLIIFAQNQKAISWHVPVAESQIAPLGPRHIQPDLYRCVTIDLQELQQLLQGCPVETSGLLPSTTYRLQIPMPNGNSAWFEIYESPIMEPGLAIQFPDIKTYAGYGVDDPTASLRFDLTPQGFHAMILSAQGTYFIDPYCRGNTQHYIVYDKKNFRAVNKLFDCQFSSSTLPTAPSPFQAPLLKQPSGSSATGSAKVLLGDCSKRTYRLALAATGEYTAFHGGTVALAQAAQVTTMNRVNGVYERELAVRMNIVANNNLLIYTNASSDPYTNGTPGTMITQNQTNVTNVIGSANYDIGHVFGTNSGGLAGLGVVCVSGSKARGVTGSGAPVGDPFDIDYVAHEIGHQFGGNHTFNGTAGSCAGNGASSASYEPGSGTTIMAYAGICGTQNVQSNSDDYFHIHSLIEIQNFLLGTGSSCDANTALTNNPPVITSTGGNRTIPISTPFMLTGAATDPDAAQTLTYCWEQYNREASTQPPVATATAGPNFRSFVPDTSPTRFFPRLQTLVSNATSTWEVLPSVSRTMTFQLSVRDNAAGGGCVDRQSMTVTFSNAAGPFTVTYPTATGISWIAGSSQTVTWNRANTHLTPVNCPRVNIYLSTNGGFSYPITLATNVPNIGSWNVLVPNNLTTTARVMVKAADNIFFDISNNNFSIISSTNQQYTLTTTENTDSVCAPSPGVFSLQLGSLFGYSAPVTLSASGLPSGATATFSPNPVSPGNTCTVTINGTGALANGAYLFSVNASASSGNQTILLQMVTTAASPAATLLLPSNAFNGASVNPIVRWSSIPPAASYTLQIATDSLFNQITYTSTGTDTIRVVSPALNPSATYYWRVISTSACGSTATSSIFSFKTGVVVCTVYNSTDVPKTITATGTPTVNSTLSITPAQIIQDVNVSTLTGTHTSINNLTFQLLSPSGTSVTLMQNICATQDNFNIKFDDESGSAYNTIPCPPTNGNTYRPLNLLSAFDGQAMNGSWTMRVVDNASNNGGSLTAWGLNVCAYVPCTLSATATATATACSVPCNGTLNATASSGTTPYSYLWSNGASTASQTAVCAGSYSLTITDSRGCTASAQTSVSSSGSSAVTPAISIAASSNTICSGTAVTFTATPVNGGSSPSYQWKINGQNAGSNSATFSSITLNQGDVVNCVLTSSELCVTSSTATSNSISLTVNPVATPAITISTPTISVCTGSSVTFNATAINGGTSAVYQWTINGQNAGTNSNTFTTTTLTNGDVVACILTSNAVCAQPTSVTSSSLTITVSDPVVPSVVLSVPPGDLCSGQPVTVTATAVNGGNIPSFQWTVNGLNSGPNAASISISNPVNGDQIGCTLTSNAACAVPAVVTATPLLLTITPTVTPVISISTANTAVCSGSPVLFTATTGNGGSNPLFNWQVNGNNVGSGSDTLNYSFTGNASVRCVLSSDAVCASTGSVNSNVLNMTTVPAVTPTISINTPTPSVCSGAAISFTASGLFGGLAPIYEWQVNGVSVLTGSTQFTLSNPTDGDEVSCIFTSSANCPQPATVTAQAITVQVKPTPPSPTISSNSPLCAGESLQLAIPAVAGAEYNWSGPNGFTANTANAGIPVTDSSQSGNYSVVVTVNGCSSAPATEGVVIHTLPEVPVITVSGTTLTSSASAGNQWIVNGTDIVGATNIVYEALEDGWYQLRVRSADSCFSLSDSVWIKITGIAENSTGGISLYPNPAREGIILIGEAGMEVRILNALGQVMYRTVVEEKQIRIRVANWARGIYVAEWVKGSRRGVGRFIRE